MAGFDYEFTTKPGDELLQRQLLRRMQTASRELGLRLNYRREPDGFYVTLDGPLPAMQSLPAYCYSELEAIAAVAAEPKDSRRRKRILARVLNAFEPRLQDMTDSIAEIGDILEAHGSAGIPLSLDFDAGSKSHLNPTLRAFRLAMIQAHIGRITNRSMLEDCHTVIEHLMNALLSRQDRRSLSFAEKVDAIVAQGVFDLTSENKRVLGDLPEQLKELKDCRRDSKHRGQDVDPDTVERLAWATTNSVQVLLAAMRQQDTVRGGGSADRGP